MMSDNTAVRVTAAEPQHAVLLASLHEACFNAGHQRPWDADAMAQFIAGPGMLCLLATCEGEAPAPSGFLIARAAADETELLSIGVLPAFRQSGIGRMLLSHAIETLRAAGTRLLFLEVDEGNASAVALYRALGAEAVGRRPGYYDDGADAAIFRIALRD